MNDLVFSSPQFGNVRVKGTPDNPLFCLADVCKSLDLQTAAVTRRLEDGVISSHPITDALGRQQNANFVNEDGLYDVIFDSRKPEAKAFRKWVTSEVLPSIRKTGSYSVPKRTSTAISVFGPHREPRKTVYPIERDDYMRDFYRELWRYVSNYDIDNISILTHRPRRYVIEVLRGRKMSWKVLEYLVERATYNKGEGINCHLSTALVNPSAIREQRCSAIMKFMAQSTPSEREAQKQLPFDIHFNF